MSNYYVPKYIFKVISYTNNYFQLNKDNLSLLPKYLYIEVEDKNKECENQKYSFFLSLKDMYVFREGKTITIGNKNKEINLVHYEIDQADDNYNKLKGLLNLP